jgi:hypothetical protein
MSTHYVEGSSGEAIESVDKAYTGGHLEVDWKDEDDSRNQFFSFGCKDHYGINS